MNIEEQNGFLDICIHVYILFLFRVNLFEISRSTNRYSLKDPLGLRQCSGSRSILDLWAGHVYTAVEHYGNIDQQPSPSLGEPALPFPSTSLHGRLEVYDEAVNVSLVT